MSDVLTTAPTVTPVSVSEFKDHENLDATFSRDDALIQSYITAATLLLEQRTNRCFVHQTRTLKMQTFDDERYTYPQNTKYSYDRSIRPPRSPLSSVTSVVYLDADATSTTLSASLRQ